METSQPELLQALVFIIATMKDIPGLIWGALIALSGVFVSNRDNTKRLKLQLAHDRDMKRADREFNTKRDIYLDATEAITVALRTLSHFSQLDIPHDELTKEYVGKTAAIAKVQIIGSPKTIAALNDFNMHMTKSVMKLTAMRTPLMGERSSLLVDEASVARAQKDFDEVMEAYKQYNHSGSYVQSESDRMNRNSDYTLERLNTLRDTYTQKSVILNLKALEIYKVAVQLHIEATAYLPPLVESVREELRLPIDSTFMVTLQEKANLQMIQMRDEIEALMKAEAAKVTERMAQKAADN